MNGDGSDGPAEPAVAPSLRTIDLFAGCGGLTAGFVATGRFSAVAAVELDLAAAATYAANFGEAHVHRGDIADWLASDVPAADVVVGGPPCQGFSNLGSRDRHDPRNRLWRRYVDTILRAQPRAFLLENVDRFAVSPEYTALRRATTQADGRLRDYRLDTHVVRAPDFGAAQLRRRTIVLGTHRDLDPIDVPRDRKPAEEWATVRDAIADLDPHLDPETRDLPSHTVEAFGEEVPGAFKAADLHVTRYYTPRSLRRFAYIPPGGNRLDIPDHLKAPCWIGHVTGSLDVMGRMHWDRPSVTIRTEFFKPEKGRYLHPTEPRAITHHEAARLQGFPDEFLWCGTKAEIARQIGNAVPVPLAAALAEHLHNNL